MLIIRQFFFFLFMLGTITSFGQVQIGEGVHDLQNIPFRPFYNYSYTQSIYLSSEINTAGEISGLKWNYSGVSNLSNSQSLTIYIGHTNKDNFNSDTDWIDFSELTLVYEGGIDVSSGTGWIPINLDTPFQYNGADNIVLAVKEGMMGYDEYSDDFLCTATSSNRSLSYKDDYTIPEPQSPPPGDLLMFFPNIILDGISQNCTPPTNLQSAILNTTSAQISWVSDGNDFSVEYGLVGFEPGQGETISGITEQVYVLENLNSGTTYDFYVAQICDGDQSTQTGPFTFTTVCEPTDVPYLQDFESSINGSLPDCTIVENLGQGNNWILTDHNIDDLGFASGYKLTYKYHNSNDADTWFYTQGLNLSEGVTYTLTYRYGKYNNSDEKFKVSWGNEPTHTAMNNELVDHTTVPQGSAVNSITFSPEETGVYYIGFNAYSPSYQYYLYVDDIIVETEGTEPCNTPVPDGDPNQTFLSGETLESLEVVGQNLKWYESSELTVELDSNTLLENDTTYYVTQTIEDCESEALAITVNIYLGTNNFKISHFSYYPNPVKNKLYISSLNTIETIEVSDLTGKNLISKNNLNISKTTIDLASLPKGVYIVYLKSKTEKGIFKILKI